MSKEKNNWNNFVIANEGSFLQSWQWGVFQEALGRKIWRLNVADQLVGLVIKHKLPFKKSYLYCPYGPVVKNTYSLKAFIRQLESIAQSEGAIFLKIEPQTGIKHSLLVKTDHLQPKQTSILDISLSDEQILAKMHQKTRYNIRLAQKKGIDVKIIDQPSAVDIDIFWQLAQETAKRDKFKLHSREYYETMLKVLADERVAKLFLAKYRNKTIAASENSH